jgi:hypothetical protein
MGQAKARGTFDERKAEAIALKEVLAEQKLAEEAAALKMLYHIRSKQNQVHPRDDTVAS